MQISDNVLSRNLSKIFGDEFTEDFKEKVEHFCTEMSYSITPGSVKNCIIPSSDHMAHPFRFPSLKFLEALAKYRGCSIYDFFSDSNSISLSSLPKIKQLIIRQTLSISDEDTLSLIHRYIERRIEIFQLDIESTRANSHSR